MRHALYSFTLSHNTNAHTTTKKTNIIIKQIPLYERAGFARAGASDVVHGADPWFEMVAKLDNGGRGDGGGGGGGD